MDIQIQLLGPMAARMGDVSILPSAGKPRQALALLALQANQVVSVPMLMEEIWGTELPRSAPTTLQTYILQLRRKLNAATPLRSGGPAKTILTTVHGGYRLELPAESIDSHEFVELLGRGQEALRRSDDATAVRLLRQALDLWRGLMLVDVTHGRMLEIEVLRLEESRLGAIELRIAAELRLGRHMELLGELTALAAEHRMHESLHAQLMVALYRAGRPGAALEVFRQLRVTLIDELGLEPCPSLQRLHQAVLNADPALEGRRRRPDEDGVGLLPL